MAFMLLQLGLCMVTAVQLGSSQSGRYVHVQNKIQSYL